MAHWQFNNSTRIYYTINGHGKQRIVFLHGFGTSILTWHEIIPFFDPDKYTCYLIDLKGFGKSSKVKDNDYGILTQAEIVKSFILSENLNNLILIGHSYGGSISLLLSIDLPHLINKMILIDPAAFTENVTAVRFLRMPLINYLIMKLFTARFQAKFTLCVIFSDHKKISKRLVDRYASIFSEKGIAYSFITSARQSIPENYYNLISKYHEISIPVLIIWGKQDRIVSYRFAEKLYYIIKSSRLAVIDGCGHNPHEEKPEETFRHIEMFLSK